jgi:hypothetical protein
MESLTSVIEFARTYSEGIPSVKFQNKLEIKEAFVAECIEQLNQADRRDLICALIHSMGRPTEFAISLIELKRARIIGMATSSVDIIARHKGVENVDWQYAADGTFIVTPDYFWKISASRHADLRSLVGAIYAGWCVLESEIKYRIAQIDQDRSLAALADLSLKIDAYELESDQTSEEDIQSTWDVDYFVI